MYLDLYTDTAFFIVKNALHFSHMLVNPISSYFLSSCALARIRHTYFYLEGSHEGQKHGYHVNEKQMLCHLLYSKSHWISNHFVFIIQ